MHCQESKFEFVFKNIRSLYSDGEEFQIRKCLNCGLKYTFPEPKTSVIYSIYSKEYRYDLHRLFSSEKSYRAKRLLKSLKFSRSTTANLNVLELGAGNLELSNVLHLDYGFKVTAVDRNIQPSSKIAVFDMSIENYLKTQNGRYDYIFLSHTLEHLYRFDIVLEEICSFLNPEGRIVIVVPNALKRNEHWGYWAIPVHLFHFTEDFLKYIANKNNLEVEHIDFKSIDTLGFLSGVSAKMGLKRNVVPSKLVLINLKIFSWFFRFGYHFGNSDLIFMARKQ